MYAFPKEDNPSLLSWNISYICNLRCIHCYTDSGKSTEPPDARGTFRSIIDELKQSGIRTLCIGGGEPMIFPGIADVVKYALGIGMNVFLCTNGYKPPPEVVETLPQDPHFAISVGLDGGTPETCEKVRGKREVFFETLNSVLRFSLKGIYTIVDFTANKINWRELPQVVANVSAVGARQVNLKRFIPIGRGAVYKNELSISKREQGILMEKVLGLRQNGIIVEAQDPLMNTMGIEPSIERGMMTGRCWLGMTPQLALLPSPTMPIPLGNLFDKGIAHIWNNAELIDRLSKPECLEGKCNECEYARVCGGHREYAYAASGSPFSQDPLCWRI